MFSSRQRAFQVGLPYLTAAAALYPAGGAVGQCQYEVTVLDYPFDCALGTVITNGHALNEAGAVVGSYKCPIWTHTEAFLWTPEDAFVTLPRPPGVTSSGASDISNEGTIVGTYIRSGVGGFRGFVYRNLEYTELPPLQGPWSWANAISDDGVVVVGGRTIRDTTAPFNAYIWTAEDGFTDLGVMNGPASDATEIGPANHVVGWTGNGGSISQGFIVDDDGGLTILPPIPGGATSGVGGITADGIVVGGGRTVPSGPDVTSVGFLWRDGEFLQFIDPLPAYDTSAGNGINGARQVAGHSCAQGTTFCRGYLWQHGVTHDLNDLVPPDTLLIGIARDVNERGQIVAQGPNGHTFLLTPVRQPTGDLDIDCAVGITDFLRLLAEWGRPDSPADLNGDGTVDLLDFSILIDNWG